jgi:hypothetical protein
MHVWQEVLPAGPRSREAQRRIAPWIVHRFLDSRGHLAFKVLEVRGAGRRRGRDRGGRAGGAKAPVLRERSPCSRRSAILVRLFGRRHQIVGVPLAGGGTEGQVSVVHPLFEDPPASFQTRFALLGSSR